MALPRLLKAFQTPACFTLEEAVEVLDKPRSTVLEQVRYLRKRGYLRSVRRGLYAFDPDATGRRADRFVVASKVASPYVLGYHSALELHGFAESVFYDTVHVATPARFAAFDFEGTRVRRVAADPELIAVGAVEHKRSGQTVKVASRELALVQCADRVKYAGGLEEVLLSVQGFPSLAFDALKEVLSVVDKKVLYRKVGFILTYLADRWDPPSEVIAWLATRGGGQAAYFGTDPGRGGTLVPAWDLIVPARFAERVDLDEEGEGEVDRG